MSLPKSNKDELREAKILELERRTQEKLPKDDELREAKVDSEKSEKKVKTKKHE